MVLSDPTEFCVVSLIEKDLSAYLLCDDVPRVLRPRAAHQRRQDAVCGKDVGLGVGASQLPDDRVVGRGYRVEDAVDALQRALVLYVDAVERLLVVF